MAKTEVINNDAVTLRVAEDSHLETALEAAEKTMEVLEDKMDTLETTAREIVTVSKNNPLIVAGAFVVGVGIGVFVGYKIAQRRLEAKFEEELDRQLDAARDMNARLQKTDEFETPESAVAALIPPEEVAQVLAKPYQGTAGKIAYDKPSTVVLEEPPQVVVEKVEVNNVFQTNVPDPTEWDFELEVADREANPGQPFVISHEEFTLNEGDHEQTTLVYYQADDTLCDSRDQPIEGSDKAVGDDNLVRFGAGSNDPNVVYIRNENLDTDFEVVRHEGSYKEHVLGWREETDSLSHSFRRASRRNRSADE